MSEWHIMQFDQAVLVNPPVPLVRDRAYPFVDMQAVDPATRDVRANELREFKASGSRFSHGDTLLARITPCLENGKIARYVAAFDEPHAHGSTEFIVIRGRPEVTDTAYAYYLTKWDGVRNYCISQMTGSSGRQRVPTSSLSHLEVALPPLSEQRAIACILGVLDDKIELNRKRCRTLEAMARAIFQSWFVDFDPVHENMRRKASRRRQSSGQPGDNTRGLTSAARFDDDDAPTTREDGSNGFCLSPEIAALFPDSFEDSPLGPIPKGWRVGTVGEVADVVGGNTPSTKEPAYWEGGSHHWATPKDLSNLRVPVLLETERKITDAGLERISSGLLPVGTVLLSSRAPIGYLAINQVPVAINQGFIALRPRKGVSAHFLLRWAETAHDAIVSRANGSTFLEISKVNFRPIQLVVPDEAVHEEYNRLVSPFFQQVVNHEIESRTLAALRDALLPKLISGELRVKDAERIVGRAT